MVDWNSEHWTNPVVNKADEGTYENIMRCFPNLQALPRGTTFTVYREFIVRRNVIQVTVYAKTPDNVNYRLDADLQVETLDEAVELMPKDFLITSWEKLEKRT